MDVAYDIPGIGAGVRYPLHNPFGPAFYRNIHLIPPSHPSARPPSLFSPSFPPISTDHNHPGPSRTTSRTSLPTPSSSQTKVTDTGRSRKTSQSTPDNVDLMDVTDPWGTSWHHTSPYDIGLHDPRRPRRASMTAAHNSSHTPTFRSPLSQSTSAVHELPPIHMPRKLSKRRRPSPTKHLSVLGRLVRTLSQMRRSLGPHRPLDQAPREPLRRIPPPQPPVDPDAASYVSVEAPFSIGRLTIANPDLPDPDLPPSPPAKDDPPPPHSSMSSIPFPPASYPSCADTPMSGISVLANPPTPQPQVVPPLHITSSSSSSSSTTATATATITEQKPDSRREEDRPHTRPSHRRASHQSSRDDSSKRDDHPRKDRDRERDDRARRDRERDIRREVGDQLRKDFYAREEREKEREQERERERREREERERKEREREREREREKERKEKERERREKERREREERERKEKERREREEREKERERREREEREKERREREEREKERREREEREKRQQEEREEKEREERERKNREERERKDREERERKDREEKERKDREREKMERERERAEREEREKIEREQVRKEKEKEEKEKKREQEQKARERRKEEKKPKDEERDQKKREERKRKDEKEKERRSKDELKHRSEAKKSKDEYRDKGDKPREKSARRRDKERKDRPNLNKPTPSPPPLPSSSNFSSSTEPQPPTDHLTRQSSTSTRPTSQLASAADLNALRAKEVWEMERLWKARSAYGTGAHGTALPAGGTMQINGSSSSVGVETHAQVPMGMNLGPSTINGVYGSSYTAFAIHQNSHVNPFQHRLGGGGGGGGGGGIYFSPIAARMNEYCPSPATIPSLHESLTSYEIPSPSTLAPLVINGPYNHGVCHGLYGGSSPGLIGSTGGVSGTDVNLRNKRLEDNVARGQRYDKDLPPLVNPLPMPPRESAYEPAKLTSEYWTTHPSELTSTV